MLIKDCYVGMIVIATPEANSEYGITVEGVIGVIDDIDDYKEDGIDIESIHIRPAGVQTSEEVMDLIRRAKSAYEIIPNMTDEFFDEGYWVSPQYFEPYYEESKIAVSLLPYLM